MRRSFILLAAVDAAALPALSGQAPAAVIGRLAAFAVDGPPPFECKLSAFGFGEGVDFYHGPSVTRAELEAFARWQNVLHDGGPGDNCDLTMLLLGRPSGSGTGPRCPVCASRDTGRLPPRKLAGKG